MTQSGLFDFHKRISRIDKVGDPLVELDRVVDWEQFRTIIELARQKPRKSSAGAKGYDDVMMFKILILQGLYNLSDEAMEYQVLDRYSFSRFLGIRQGSKVPDATTIFRFRDELAKASVIELLFTRFDQFLSDNGFRAQKGQIIDANIVSVPVQRNSRKENADIKAGKPVRKWNKAKRRQKNTDARWTKKNGKSFFGYKNHISIDTAHKFIRSYEVTDASVHDSRCLPNFLIRAIAAEMSGPILHIALWNLCRSWINRDFENIFNAKVIGTKNLLNVRNVATTPGREYAVESNTYLVSRRCVPVVR